MSEILLRLEKIAESLPGIIDRLVFVGGGVTEILITDSAGRKPRPTEDVDCIIEVASRLEYNRIEERLRQAGFHHDSNIPPLICRWEKDEVILDVMPTMEGILGFTNRWYKDAVVSPMTLELPNGLSVNIVQSVYYLATKTEAFQTRGKGDYFTSHDFEDIAFIVNGRAELVAEMQAAESHVQNEMKDFWLPRLDTANMKAAMRAHIDAYEDNGRSPIALDRFKRMLS